MASLHSDRKGYLLVSFYYQGRRYREYLGLKDTRDNRRDKKRWLDDLAGALRGDDFDFGHWFPDSRRAQPPRSAAAPRTLADHFNAYIDTLEISKATRYDLECLRREYIERIHCDDHGGTLASRELQAVTPADIRAVVKRAREAGKHRRVIVFLQRLRSMFDVAIEDGLLEKNPARRVKNPKRRDRAEIVPHFTIDEQTAILATAKGRDRNLIALMLGTGIGPGEACALRPGDIDLTTRKIFVGGSLSRFGEGATKTESRTRHVDILDTVAPVTAALRDQLKVQNLRGPLFVNRDRGHLDFGNWRKRNWHRILTRAAVEHRHPYTCRHTYAIRMLEAGYDVVYIARQMGHTGPAMMMAHYARWIGASIKTELKQKAGV